MSTGHATRNNFLSSVSTLLLIEKEWKNAANSYLFKVNNIITRKRREICSRLTIKGVNYFCKNIPANIYLFKVNNRNTRKRCEICSKLTIKTPERRHMYVCVSGDKKFYLSGKFCVRSKLTIPYVQWLFKLSPLFDHHKN